MPSPEEGTQPKRESGSGQNPDPPPPPPPQPQPATANPPPAMGYPGYPPPYPAYGNPPYGHQYPYNQPPPGAYYGASGYPTHQTPITQNPASGFFRGIVAGLVILLLLMCLSSIITWLILHPKLPSFAVTQFAVSGFNATGPGLSAQWTANLTIENDNTKLKAYFTRINSFMYYNDPNGEDDLLATATLAPMFVDTEKSEPAGTSLTVGKNDTVPSWVVDDLRKERGTGTVSFSLRMIVVATFKTQSITTSERVIKVFCEKLKVGFDRDTGNGAVLLPKPHQCAVYI